MEEKEIIELSTEIILSLTKLSLGEKPSMLSGKVFKTLNEHQNFAQIKSLYAHHLINFEGTYSSTEDLKKLTDLRYKLVDLYQS